VSCRFVLGFGLASLGLVACGSSPGASSAATIPSARGVATVAAPHPLSADERRAAACAGASVTRPHAAALPARSDWVKLGNVVRVDVRGSAAAETSLRPRLGPMVGAPIDAARVGKAIRELWASGLVDEVAVSAEPTTAGVVLAFVVTERPAIASTFYVLPDGATIDAGVDERISKTAVFDPATLARDAEDIRTSYEILGHRRAKVDASAAAYGTTIDVCYRVTPGPRFTIASLAFPGAKNVPEAELLAGLDTKNGTANKLGQRLDVDALGESLQQVARLYYERGMVSHRIGEPVITESASPGDATLKIEIPITEGPIFRWGKITFTGPLALPVARYETALGIKRGEIFQRSKLAAGLSRVKELQRIASHADADAEPETTVDVPNATISLKVVVAAR
jgi:outer membrane protein insertion porin family